MGPQRVTDKKQSPGFKPLYCPFYLVPSVILWLGSYNIHQPLRAPEGTRDPLPITQSVTMMNVKNLHISKLRSIFLAPGIDCLLSDSEEKIFLCKILSFLSASCQHCAGKMGNKGISPLGLSSLLVHPVSMAVRSCAL